MVTGKIMQNPGSPAEDFIFKTKKFTNIVKGFLFKLDEKDAVLEGGQSQVHFVIDCYSSGKEKRKS